MNTLVNHSSRIKSIDIVRGIVMVIMALDHIRDLIHVESLTKDPTDLDTTTPILFLTRWITHLCAPTFVFLSGVSAYLSMQRENSLKKSRKFLIVRGAWLLVLEFTIVNFGIWFDVHFRVFLFQVIGAIGLGFIALGTLLSCHTRVVGLIGLAIIVSHNLLPVFPFPDDSILELVLSPLFQPGLFALGEKSNLLIGYPPVPWIGILFLGFWFGQLFELSYDHRKRLLFVFGGSFILLFAIMRAINWYGDPSPWAIQENMLFTILSFINVTKYPPSLLFDLLMLGLMFLLLGFAERLKGKVADIISVYGEVPLFYYLLHWYIIHSILFMVLFAQGFSLSDFEFGFNFGRPGEPSGLSLLGVYLLWVGVIVLLYPICRWYGDYKRRNREKKWLRFL